MNAKSSLREARDELTLERAAFRRRETARVDALRAGCPEAAALADEMRAVAAGLPRACLSRPREARDILREGEARRLALRGALSALLAEKGLPEDAFDERYLCPECRDQGTVGSDILEDCACVRRRATQILTRRSGLTGASGSFDRSDLSAFPDAAETGGASQRMRMRQAYEDARAYAEAFPDVPKPHWFITGKSGLGKSFFAECVTRRISERGTAAALIPAGQLSEIMRRHHMEAGGSAEMRHIQEIPFLFLDDLGSEPIYENLTIPHLFTLLNNRKRTGRATGIITNLMPPEFGERYTERVLSRALDISSTRLLLFTGRDIRVSR